LKKRSAAKKGCMPMEKRQWYAAVRRRHTKRKGFGRNWKNGLIKKGVSASRREEAAIGKNSRKKTSLKS